MDTYPTTPALASASAAARPPYRYNGWFLGILCVAFVGSLGTIWVLPSSNAYSSLEAIFGVALLVYVAVMICILVVDWRGFLTLHGHVNWRTLGWPGRIGLVLLYALLWVLVLSMPALYLGFAVKDTYTRWRTAPSARELKTAELEASLGMLPGTEGVCARCHKPLQAGAEYCAYCGEPTVSRPRVCPQCATIAPPGASYCPHCRALLSPSQPS